MNLTKDIKLKKVLMTVEPKYIKKLEQASEILNL